jgi:hypothetical protein
VENLIREPQEQRRINVASHWAQILASFSQPEEFLNLVRTLGFGFA